MTDMDLIKFRKPYFYFGNELNSVHKAHSGRIKIAFVYPDLYEIGMSSLGYKILYHLVNEIPDVVVERAFAPLEDMEAYLRDNYVPLFTLESHIPLKDFDLIAVSVQSTMDFTNILNILSLSQIELHAKNRKHPIVFMGGTSAYNPEPLWEFFDFFAIGEGEGMFPRIVDKFREWNRENKKDFLKRVSTVKGVYVPDFFEVDYNEEGRISKIHPLTEEKVIVKDIVEDLDTSYFPVEPVVPYGKVVMDKAFIEIFRGCTQGCRFCQAGMVYRPVREKSVETIAFQIEETIKNTGYEEITLLSLNTGDYSRIDELLKLLGKLSEKYRVSISLPSLRVDTFSEKLGNIAVEEGIRSVTFSIEAATERLRGVINKTITEEAILKGVRTAMELGFHTLKFYFVIGLPTEKDEDIEAIPELVKKVYTTAIQYSNSKKPVSIHISINPFMPQPHTPFQWEEFENIDELERKRKIVSDNIKGKQYRININDFRMNYIETMLNRGDRRLSKVIESAWKKGCKMDAWSEHFNFNLWREALLENNVDSSLYTESLPLESILSWDHISCGVSKSFLKRERENALKGIITPDCRSSKCSTCGINQVYTCKAYERTL